MQAQGTRGRRAAGPVAASTSDTRFALLSAGLRLYGEPSANLLRWLTAGAVAEEAGFHRQTFYRYWDTQEQYVEDLIELTLDDDAEPVADGVTVVPRRRVGRDSTFAGLAADIARYDFERLRNDASLSARIGIWSLREVRPDVAEGVTRCHDRAMEHLTDGYEQLFDEWGRSPRPPFEVDDIARIFDALLLGLVLRPPVADAQEPVELYEQSVRELLPGLTLRVQADLRPAASG
jgi:AcrR family transcriptional regulator